MFVRAFVHTHLKPLSQRFRVGESLLVRWADEDMGVLGDGYEEYASYDGEIDDMVNGRARREDDELEWLDEQIPLKPSPRLRREFVDYGTARQ